MKTTNDMKKQKKQWKKLIVKTLKHNCFFFVCNFKQQTFMKNYQKNNLKLWFLAHKYIYLDTKTKSIPLAKLVKSKLKIFHTRVYHLVVTFNISATIVVVVVVAHIYPPVTGQRQTLTCWTIRTLFITRTTSWLEESAPA